MTTIAELGIRGDSGDAVQAATDLGVRESFGDASNYRACVLLLLVHEHQFFNTLKKLKRENDVVLSASLRTDARSNDFSNYHVDVALIRTSASGQMNVAH